MAAIGLSDERAARFMFALRDGTTPHIFGVNSKSLETYFAAHPDYASEARPLIEANAKAARHRKGDKLRSTTHCRAGLHLMSGDNVFIDGTHGRRRCLACRRASTAKAEEMRPEVVAVVKAALQNGATFSQICRGRPAGGGTTDRKLLLTQTKVFYRHRKDNPEFDSFVTQALAANKKVWLARRRTRIRNEALREERNDYQKIRAMLPAGFPDKDDVVSAIFEDLLSGVLVREQVKARVQTYIASHNRMFPTRYRKFGDSQLLSLDEVMFDDGTATRGDTVSRGLWD
jgi:hypothetical protein